MKKTQDFGVGGGGGVSNFLERDKEGLPKFLTDEGGEGLLIFLST